MQKNTRPIVEKLREVIKANPNATAKQLAQLSGIKQSKVEYLRPKYIKAVYKRPEAARRKRKDAMRVPTRKAQSAQKLVIEIRVIKGRVTAKRRT